MGGGGAPLLPFLRSMHAASTVQARGAALVCGGGALSFCSLFPSWPPRSLRFLSFSLCGGGGLAVWLLSVPFVPCVPASGDKHVARTLQAHSTIAL